MAWKKLCALDELPANSLTPLEVDGVEVLLARTETSVAVIPPLCPHMKEPLANGLFDGATLTCLKHLWQWDIETGHCMGEAESALCLYPVKVVDGYIVADLSRELTYEYEA